MVIQSVDRIESKARLHSAKRSLPSGTPPLVRWSRMNSPLGQLFVAVSPQGLCAVAFGEKENESLSRLSRKAKFEKNDNATAKVLAQLREYFSGRSSSFDLPLDLSSLTPFQREVLTVTRKIPAGKTWTYRQVAQEMGRPNSARPVGQALARNPIPIVIPCHRVIASDGSLRGYSGGSGLKAKRWLLRHEGAL